jgi:hypothetical protein
MGRTLSLLDFIAASALTLLAVLLFANSQLCWFNRESCGMVEPIVAVYALALAIPLTLAGLFHRRGKNYAAAASYVPAALVVVATLGQARDWW